MRCPLVVQASLFLTMDMSEGREEEEEEEEEEEAEEEDTRRNRGQTKAEQISGNLLSKTCQQERQKSRPFQAI